MKKLFYYFLMIALVCNFVGCPSSKSEDEISEDEINESQQGTSTDDDWKGLALGDCFYSVSDRKGVAIIMYGYSLYNPLQRAKGDFIIPQKITYASKTYKVIGIGDAAFGTNNEITSITCHDEIESIGNLCLPQTTYLDDEDDEDYDEYTSFKKLIVGKGIKSIGNIYNSACTHFTTTIYATTPPTIELVTIFNDGPKLHADAGNPMELYVPEESIEAYKAHKFWKYFSIHKIEE